jgi:8-oxo-dGTP diphosphatase
MSCYLAEIISGEILLVEHTDAKWLTSEEIHSVDWLPADLVVVEQIIKRLKSGK